MTRLLAAPALLMSLAPAAPVPKDRPALLYFPTTVGATWVYEVEADGERFEHTLHVVGADPDPDGGTAVRVNRLIPHPRPGERPFDLYDRTLVVSPAGLAVRDIRWNKFDPPLGLIRLPARKGESWRWTNPGEWMRMDKERGNRTVAGVEEVEVPAGRYRAVRVGFAGTVADETVRSTHWYAPGVGEVRSDKEEWNVRLKSFTPGDGTSPITKQ